MSELQNANDDLQDDFVEDAGYEEVEESAELEEASDLATDSDEQHEEKAQKINQDAINEAINKQHRKYKEEERKRLELEKRLAELEKQGGQQSQLEEVPPIPDYYDDDYETKLRRRDEIIQRNAQAIAQQQWVQQQQQAQDYQQQQQRQAELTQKVETYASRAKMLGVDRTELQNAGELIASYGLNEEVTIAILEDEQGPLITKYLASNPLELSSVVGMTPLQAVLYIERNVKSKAAGLKPRTSNTPPPADRLNSGRADPEAGQLKYAKGGKFE